MSTRLNLASRPFRNLLLPWTITGLVVLICIVALFFIVRGTFQANQEAQAGEREVNRLLSDITALTQRFEAIKTDLTPDQQLTLKSAHTLVNRKQFSWTLLFADLEAALPGTVKVSRISVKEVSRQGDRTGADLILTVVCKNPATVTQMIEDMARDGVFRAELVSQTLQQGRGESGAEYEMNVHYVPRVGVPIETSERNNHVADTRAGNRIGTQ